MDTKVSSTAREVTIGLNRPTVIIGERINPSGKKKMADALREGKLEIIRDEALAQVAAGADIIDVNVSAPGVDEVSLLPQVVRIVMEAVNVPLCLDSSNPDVLAAGLKVYRGKPLINSVSGEEHSLARVLPLVKEYGAAVVGLLQDDAGVSSDVEKRVAIAHKIVSRAESAGVPRENILIDCLAISLSVNSASVVQFLETARRVRAELGVNLTCGASNISYGLPERELVNSAFLTAAIMSGVNCLITDAAKLRPAILAADLIGNRDPYARRYITSYRQRLSAQPNP